MLKTELTQGILKRICPGSLVGFSLVFKQDEPHFLAQFRIFFISTETTDGMQRLLFGKKQIIAILNRQESH